MLSFEGGCEWFPSLLSGYEFEFDAWHWLAARTDPLGQSLDLSNAMRDQYFQGLEGYPSRHEATAWNVKFDDRTDDRFHKQWFDLDRTYSRWPTHSTVFYDSKLDSGRDVSEFTNRLAPPVSAPVNPDRRLPQFEPRALLGNDGDVKAKGNWEDGFWTVEFRRRLTTESGPSWDIQFVRLTQFSIHVFNGVERIDQASESGRLFLQFVPKEDVSPLPSENRITHK
jgi:hypothetical protein